MLQFMTTIPIWVSIKADKEDFGKGLVLAPVVGLLIGVLLAGGNYMLGLLFPPLVTAVLTIVFYIILTGGLHLDGLGDTADGLFSNRPRERMLEIMKDSRVGTNAVLILIIVVFLDISLLSSIQNQTIFILLFMPVAGRIASIVGAGSSQYAGTSDGPGRWCVELCGLKDVLSGLVIYFVIFATAAGITGLYTGVTGFLSGVGILLTALIPPFSAFVLVRFFGSKLGGVTGDILGAVCELNQVVFLLTAFLLLGL
jgi:adenosylcobinamide-GDP ribazoletransferase